MIQIPDQSQAIRDATLIFGNTLRLGIIRQLSLGKDNRADIAKALGVGEEALTRQMATLIDHKLVTSTTLRGAGRPVRYSLNSNAVDDLLSVLDDYRRGFSIPTKTQTTLPAVDSRSYRKRTQ